MRLIIDCLIYKKGKAFGYQEYLFNLLNYFYLNFHLLRVKEVIIACDKNQVNHFLLFSDLFSIEPFNSGSKIAQICSQNLLKYRLNIRNSDIILYTYNYSSLIKQGNSILVVHDLLFKRKSFLPNILFRIHRILFIPISIKNADKIIAISNFTKNDVVFYYGVEESKISVIYNYFNFNKFDKPQHKGDRIPGDSNSKYFLSVSSLARHKNIITLFKAFKIFAENNANIDLIVVGRKSNIQKSDIKYLLNLPRDVKNRISIIEGLTDKNLGCLYSSCECFISPTLFEGLGMPIVEAMYFGVPLVLSDIEICHEIAEDIAVYFDPLDFRGLGEILIQQEYRKISLINQSRVIEKFNKNNTCSKYIELINNSIK